MFVDNSLLHFSKLHNGDKYSTTHDKIGNFYGKYYFLYRSSLGTAL